MLILRLYNLCSPCCCPANMLFSVCACYFLPVHGPFPYCYCRNNNCLVASVLKTKSASLFLRVSACFYVLLPIFTYYCLFLRLTACFYVFLPVCTSYYTTKAYLFSYIAFFFLNCKLGIVYNLLYYLSRLL